MKAPLPPTPSPTRRGGARSRKCWRSEGFLRLAPPLRFGEGVGGRGCFYNRTGLFRLGRHRGADADGVKQFTVAVSPFLLLASAESAQEAGGGVVAHGAR